MATEPSESTQRNTLVVRKPCFGLPTGCPQCLSAYIFLKLSQVPFNLDYHPNYPDSGKPQSWSLLCLEKKIWLFIYYKYNSPFIYFSSKFRPFSHLIAFEASGWVIVLTFTPHLMKFLSFYYFCSFFAYGCLNLFDFMFFLGILFWLCLRLFGGVILLTFPPHLMNFLSFCYFCSFFA